MAIAGADIVSRHVLDDSDFLKGLRRDDAALRQHTAKTQASFAGLNQAVMVLSRSASVLGGDLGRVAGALRVLESASIGVMAGLGPWALGAAAVAGAYEGLNYLLEQNRAATERAAMAQTKLQTVYEGTVELQRKANVAAGLITERDARRFALEQQLGGGPFSKLQNEAIRERLDLEDQLNFRETAARNIAARDAAALSMQAERAAIGRDVDEQLFNIEARRVRDADSALQDLWETLERGNRAAMEASRADRGLIAAFEARAGLRAPSSLLDNPIARRIAEFEEGSVLARRAIEEAGGTAFAIGTRASSEFRFGAGAPGSVIGVQTESKKTNELLKAHDEHRKTEAAAIVAELKRLTGNGEPYQPVLP